MYSAVEVADFVVDCHLHHGCVVEQCILVKRGRDVVESRTMVILSWEGYFWQFVISFNDVFNEIHLNFFKETRTLSRKKIVPNHHIVELDA